MPEWKPEILRRLTPLKLAPAREAEIAEEIAQHLDDRYQELLATGQPEDAAYRTALDELKDEDLLARSLQRVEKNFYREPIVPGKTAGNLVSGIAQDVRYSFRNWVRSPAFFLFAVGVLALGVGANTAIFTVAYNVLLRPLPYRDASRLVMVWEDDSAYGFPENTPTPGNYASWKSQNSVFTGMAALRNRRFDLTGHGIPEQFLGTEITANMFPLLGVKPALGRDHSG